MSDAKTQGPITRKEREQRYGARIMERTGMSADEVTDIVAAGSAAYEEQERGCGNDVVWWGGPSGERNSPEDEADEELSYWTDDEGASHD